MGYYSLLAFNLNAFENRPAGRITRITIADVTTPQGKTSWASRNQLNSSRSMLQCRYSMLCPCIITA
ncbi:hypothetical protein NKDENANG_00608 [Candidatus Entotheonellaceae bacterium PAL068K]